MLTLNNHTLDFSANCEISLREGGRLPEGLRVLAFLERDEFRTGADWRQVALGGHSIRNIDDGQRITITRETRI